MVSLFNARYSPQNCPHTHTHTHIHTYIYISSHTFLVTFTANAYTWFSDLRASNSRDFCLWFTPQYLHVQDKEFEQFRLFLSMGSFFVSLTSLTHTKYLSILSRVFLLLKNDRTSEHIQSQRKYAHTRSNIGKKKGFLFTPLLKVQSCRYFSDLSIILDGKHKFQEFWKETCFKLNASEWILVCARVMHQVPHEAQIEL